MRKLIRFCIHLFLISTILLLLLFCILLTVMQTQWTKRYLSELIVDELRKQGIEASIEGLDGQLPFSWKIDQATLRFASGATLHLEKVSLRSAFFPLLHKHLAIDYCHIETAAYSFFQSTGSSQEWNWEEMQSLLQSKVQPFSPLIHFSIHHLEIAHVLTRNLTTDKTLGFSLEAKGRWKKQFSEFSFFGKIASENQERADLELSLEGSKARQQISAELKAHIGALESLPLPAPLPLQAEALVEADLSGPWATWTSLIWSIPSSTGPLQGKIRAKLKNTQSLNMPELLNRDWLFASDFNLLADHSCLVETLQLYSNLICLRAKGKLVSDIKQSQAVVTYSLPDLSLLAPWLDLDLSGNLMGKGWYHQGKIKTALSSEHAQLDHYSVETLRALLTAEKTSSTWQGELQFTSQAGQVPVECCALFAWEPNELLNFSDLDLKAQETSITGNLKIDLPDHLLEGSLYANIGRLSQFSPLLSARHIDGSLGVEISFSLEDEKIPSQNLHLYLLSKNLHYDDYLIDHLSLSADIADLYCTPRGQINLLAEQVFTPQAYFNQMAFNSQSNGDSWPFSLNLAAPDFESCDFQAAGEWKQEDKTFFLRLDQAEGEIAAQQLFMESPFEIEWGPSHLTFSRSEWSIGDGLLSGSASFSPEQSLADLELSHFPLQILSIFKPKFSLEGSVTGRIFFEAGEEKISGACNLALEQANFLHYGKKIPWRTKGSLQAHLDRHLLQIHTDLHAIGEQFLDLSASLPIEYTTYPFRIGIERDSPLSAELVAEGKIQDIFDFINIGTHHITGLLSCRLLLSQTYANPSLQGEMQWQNGSYENYYTGTVLHEIYADIEAHNRKVHLTSLIARDEEKGELTAEGTLDLIPEEHFPYFVTSELEDLHLLRFDTIDSYLSGPLYITGDFRSALAEGNLTVSYATFHIPDHLPYDLPQLPVTYINRPSYLDADSVTAPSTFPFHIDLELTADKDIHVEGKGLSSEWEGSVRLTGTNTSIAGNGALSMLSGEYLFSGKVFKLTEGEIIFNDKPSPSAYLNLSGELSLSDVEVIAYLRGPLTSPQLTFRSNPHMPTSSILARILFNKDIADISHPEALQLASTLMSLSGGAGPDVLEAIRKSIGVDRLTIVSSSDQIAVQIGKYLTKGVLITLSQSATSSQVIVEVELKKGFIFQAETQEEEEGKFSLKWRKTY